MGKLDFTSNARPTVGIELEMGLVDNETMALKSAFDDVQSHLEGADKEIIKQELMQCYAEVNTDVCETIDDAKVDLEAKLAILERAADKAGVGLFWGATHPFSSWRDQKVSENERYHNLIEMLQEMARRLVTFGLHVHVGVDSGDKAVMICDRILQHLPTLLAISCSSPYWDDHPSGLQSHRSKIMEGLPGCRR